LDDIPDDPRAAALHVMRHALRSDRIADRLRAAESILRVTGDAKGAARDASLVDLSDQALLEIARGVHPREKGPVVPSSAAVPSHAHTEQNTESTAQGTQNGPVKCDTPPPGLVTPDNPFLKRRPRGPKTDPVLETPRGEPEPWE
jgi:hypothetical protein